MPAKSLEDIIRLTLGDLLFRCSALTAENEALREQVAKLQAGAQGSIHANGRSDPLLTPTPDDRP
jgi:hypothetical protein